MSNQQVAASDHSLQTLGISIPVAHSFKVGGAELNQAVRYSDL